MESLARSKAVFGTILIGGLVLFLGILAFLNQLLDVVAGNANAIDARRSVEAVQSAVGVTTQRLLDAVIENASREETAARVDGPAPDGDWLYTTFGAAALPGAAYDAVYVASPDGEVAWGWAAGRRIAEGSAVPAGGLAGLAARVVAEGPRGPGRAAFAAAPDGILIAAAAMVRPPAAPGAGEGLAVPRVLIFARHLDDAVLSDIAHTFLIDDLHIARSGDRGDRYTLQSVDGAPVGALTWSRRDPGREATDAAWPHVRNALVLVSTSILLFIAISAYGLRRLSLQETRSREAALTDALSGLPNRRAATDELDRVLAAAGEDGRQSAIVFVDLDGFKDVNDTYGHGTGDQLIRMVSAGFSVLLTAGMLARLGGDEFAVVLTSRDARREAGELASNVLLFLSQPLMIGERRIQIGASIGVAAARPGECDGSELFRRADVAMYEAKRRGGNRTVFWEPGLDLERNTRQAIEESIRDGLERDEFAVNYQPIVDARSRRLTAVEALVRWPGRAEGPLPPDAFIPVAESSGLIHQLGLFVLRRACEDFARIDGVALSVNVSPAQFRDPNFEFNVGEVLAETGFPPERLELELTEGYLIEHPERAVAAIAAFKRQGISITLDDFGTGYSSIGYLRRYGFSRLKIDKSLAGRVDADPQAGALVAGTVAIADALAMKVTAEGVETAEQAALLRAAGCQKLQGFHFGRPVPLSALDLSGAELPARVA